MISDLSTELEQILAENTEINIKPKKNILEWANPTKLFKKKKKQTNMLQSAQMLIQPLTLKVFFYFSFDSQQRNSSKAHGSDSSYISDSFHKSRDILQNSYSG